MRNKKEINGMKPTAIVVITAGLLGLVSCKQDTKEAIIEAQKELKEEELKKWEEDNQAVLERQVEEGKRRKADRLRRALIKKNQVREYRGQPPLEVHPADTEGLVKKYFPDG